MRLSKPLFWLITILWFILGTWWYGCNKCTTCTSTVEKSSTSANVNFPGFYFEDSTAGWKLSSNNSNIKYGINTATPVLNEELTIMLDSLSKYALANPGKQITVTGYYTSNEANSTDFANLGLARAEDMKNWLIQKGVKAANVYTNSQNNDALYFVAKDTLVGALSFTMSNTTIQGAADDVVDMFGPFTVYFKTGENVIIKTAAFSDYLSKAKEYLNNNPTKSLNVSGYTDNIGNAQANIALSLKRAETVKAELVGLGIEAARISTEGKGMEQPIAENNTTDGRSKNRRVTIQIQ